jgi:plasmid stability protein
VNKIAKTLTIRLDENLHTEFKVYATRHNKDMTELLLEYIKKLIQDDRQENKK